MLQQCRNNVLAMYAAVCWAKKCCWELSRVAWSPLISFGAFFTKGLFRLQPSPSRFSLRKLPPELTWTFTKTSNKSGRSDKVFEGNYSSALLRIMIGRKIIKWPSGLSINQNFNSIRAFKFPAFGLHIFTLRPDWLIWQSLPVLVWFMTLNRNRSIWHI